MKIVRFASTFWLFFLINSSIEATVFIGEEPGIYSRHDFIVISLGVNCHPATFTRKHDLRDLAFPFDWCLTPYPALHEFIKADFKNYFKKENLVPSTEQYYSDAVKNFLAKLALIRVSKYESWVLDKKSGMFFIHDFPNNHRATIAQRHERFADKYQRRINRFKDIAAYNKHVYFIRYLDISKSQAIELDRLLHKKFPKLKFTLITIADTGDFKYNWGYPTIRNYYLPIHDELFWQLLCEDIAMGKLK